MDKLNKWLSVVANFGVVVGIVFLAYELRLNTATMQSSTAAQIVTSWNDISLAVAANPELADAILEANARGLEASDETVVKLMYLGSAMFKSMEFDFFEAQRGNVEPEVWAGQVRTTRISLETIPWLLVGWRFGRAGFAESFRDYVDGLVRDVCERQTCPLGGRPEDWD